MCNFDIDKWINGYKVRAFPWIDGKRVYFNVQYFIPGASIERPPVWDKTVYIAANEKGLDIVNDFLSSLTEYVSKTKTQIGQEITITF